MVVLAVIGILIALLLPAVQSVRETARRNQCRSNLHQIGLALQNYESIYGAFPACGMEGISWEVSILPQIGQAPLYSRVDFAAENPTEVLRDAQIGLYLCPADGAPSVFHGVVTVAATSYLGNSGTGVLTNGPNGVFNHFSSPFPNRYSEGLVRFADIVDGTSTTAAVSECLHSLNGNTRERLRIVWNLPRSYFASEAAEFSSICQAIPSDPSAAGWNGSSIAHGYQWDFGDIGYSTYNHVLVPMQPSCFNGTQVQDGIYSAASAHSLAVNVLFCDGHVQQVSSNINGRIWTAIGSRNGSESITEF